MSVEIHLPDNSIKSFDHEPSALEVASSISSGLARVTVGAQINGEKEIVDLRQPLASGTKLRLITTKDAEANEVIRHSAAHILAQAVQALWPDVKVTIGPVIDNGFYYDFDSPRPFSSEDLEKIEKKMKEVIKSKLPIERKDWSAEEAKKKFDEMGESYKLELIDGIGDDTVSTYSNGDQWLDLCRGPHVQSTGDVKAFKLLSVAGSYWRGDENRESLQRIYGTAFADKKDMNLYLERLEEAKKRDHRKLGKDLKLFNFHPLSPGGPFFTGRGSVIYNELQNYLRELYQEFGYDEVITPQIFDVDLYHKSGHYEHYKENMYFSEMENKEFSVKPMNCPGHCVLYGTELRSYRDLPLRVADFGRLHRFERSGTMHGLTRVRTFCQDDAHIFCTTGQMFEEIKSFMSLLDKVYNKLGMPKYKVFLSTRPEDRLGSDEIWDASENALADALKSLDIPYEINEGDGAFYGPKIDINFVDALERPWQLGTLQCDFNLPERFDLKYVGEDNADHRPVMLHRAILGSLERFIGVYLEHTAGRLPLWLSPTQVKILSLTDRQNDFCEKLLSQLKQKRIRAEWDARSEKLGFKIREAQLEKVPYMLIVGDKEMENNQVSVRLPNGETLNAMSVDEVLKSIENEVQSRSGEHGLDSENKSV